MVERALIDRDHPPKIRSRPTVISNLGPSNASSKREREKVLGSVPQRSSRELVVEPRNYTCGVLEALALSPGSLFITFPLLNFAAVLDQLGKLRHYVTGILAFRSLIFEETDLLQLASSDDCLVSACEAPGLLSKEVTLGITQRIQAWRNT